MRTSQMFLLLFFFLLLSALPSSVYSREENEGGRTDESQKTCADSFSLLEQDLLKRETNRFKLLKTFYPLRAALPVFVTVTYSFNEIDSSNRTDSPDRFNTTNTSNQSVWYWTESEFYLIQPLSVLQFTSLFHSNFPYRQTDVTFDLSAECRAASDEFIETLTSRLKLYSQSSRITTDAETAVVSDTHTAIAASRAEIESDEFQSDFVKVWFHIVLILFPLSSVCLIYLCDPIQLLLGDKVWQKLRDEANHPRLVALVQISTVFPSYVFVLDCFALDRTIKNDFLSYKENSSFYLSTVTGFFIDLVAFIWLLIVYTLIATGSRPQLHGFYQRIFLSKKRRTFTPTYVKKLMASTMVSPLLCLTNHFPYILVSFFSDPYHAGAIFMAHFLSFLLFYFSFRQFYARVALKTHARPKNFPFAMSPDLVHFPDGDACKRKVHVQLNTKVVFLGLFTIGPLVVAYELLIIVLFQALPISKSLEDAPSTLYTIYQGTGILIVALLTYSIVLSPSTFSFVRMIDRLGKELMIPEEIGRKWVRFGDEEKAAFVIATLYKKQLRLAGNNGEDPSNQLAREFVDGGINIDSKMVEEEEEEEVEEMHMKIIKKAQESSV